MASLRRLSLSLFVPTAVVLILMLFIAGLLLDSLRSYSESAAKGQADDLRTLVQMSEFARKIAVIQQRVAATLEQADAGQLDELGLYRAHSGITRDLHPLTGLVDDLAESALLRDVNHGSAQHLRNHFTEYRNLVLVATEIAVIDPGTATEYLAAAQGNYLEFSLYNSRLSGLLASRSEARNLHAQQTLNDTYWRLIWLGITAVVVLILFSYVASRHLNRRVWQVATALNLMVDEDPEQADLSVIRQMQDDEKGEFRRLASALVRFQDAIRQRKQAEARAHQLAYYDELTHLPNRQLLRDRLAHAVSASSRVDHHYAVLWLDLDRFKLINDSRGHHIGDQLLVDVAQRLAGRIHGSDTLARIGGDDFVLVLENLSEQESEAIKAAESVAERLRESLAAPFLIEGDSFNISPSIGIALFRAAEFSVDQLLKHAEAAMYQAKAAGRNDIRFYDPAMQADLEARLQLERELRQAIEEGGLQLYYQPQVDQFGKPIGVEALVRWLHPARGMVSPADFIPLAEDTGLILPLGMWVLETACRQLRAWADHPVASRFTLSVNLSAKQFRQADFAARVEALLQATGVPAARLKLELTESTVLDNVEDTITKMRALRGLGVSFSMDDFGTGYSSLQYLKRLPLNQVKIDQSFVRDITDDPDDAVIVRTIIAMGAALHLQVIAEGVETEAQRDQLAASGCHFYQGYLYSRPLPLAELETFLDISAAQAT
ncbi:MAG: EAL domain-containing protein [Marinobacter sp.]|nr:EAL domain-containing protein [Marinobacter sp.]